MPSRSLETCNYLSLIWWFDFVTHVTPDTQEKWKKQREESLAELEKEDPKSDLSKVKPFSPHPGNQSSNSQMMIRVSNHIFSIGHFCSMKPFSVSVSQDPRVKEWRPKRLCSWEFPQMVVKSRGISLQNALKSGSVPRFYVTESSSSGSNPSIRIFENLSWIQLGDFIFLGDEIKLFLWEIYVYTYNHPTHAGW